MPIVKIQRPIAPPNGDWLIYDKERKLEGLVPDADIGPDIRNLMRKDFKGYFVGERLPDGRFAVSRRVKDQNW